jgi:DNA-binding GntR family transcriptional regulator
MKATSYPLALPCQVPRLHTVGGEWGLARQRLIVISPWSCTPRRNLVGVAVCSPDPFRMTPARETARLEALTPEDEGLDSLHNRLREMILSGALEPGTKISQVQLATTLGVSRTPLREALRMLQSEGLILAKRHSQAEVPHVNLEDLESVYMQRILLESLGVSLTVRTMTPERLSRIEASLRTMQQSQEDDIGWEAEHRLFHRYLVEGAPQQARQAIQSLQDRARSYRRLYAHILSGHLLRRPVGMRDHAEIVDACGAGDADLAATRLAKHLGRTALTVITEVAPQHDPLVVRTSLQLVVREDLPLGSLQRLPDEIGKTSEAVQ